MRNYRSGTVLASVLALLVAAPVLASQLADNEVAQDVEHEVAQDMDQEVARKLEPAPSEQQTTLEQEALPVAGELAPGATDPLPEPEEVLKNKTKSNQSND